MKKAINKFKVNEVNIKLIQHQKVWSPSFFTLWLADYLLNVNWENKSVLDLGVGSGFLSIIIAKKGASYIVGADLNPDAIKTSKKNWSLNINGESKYQAVLSDCFKGVKNTHKFDAIISNPPTTPVLYTRKESRNNAWLWNENGKDGRTLLDSLLIDGPKYLRKGGKAIFINTSKQGLKKTIKLLKINFSSWRIVKEKKLELAPYYYGYLDIWKEMENENGEKAIFFKKGKMYQKLYLIEAVK